MARAARGLLLEPLMKRPKNSRSTKQLTATQITAVTGGTPTIPIPPPGPQRWN